MSASHKPIDGFVYFPETLNQFEEAMFCSQFDVQVDYDVMDIQKELKDNKILKRVCLYKLVIFIPEIIFTFIMFGRKASGYKVKESKLYYQYFRGRITIEKFKKELTDIMNSGNIV